MLHQKTWEAWRRCSHRLLGSAYTAAAAPTCETLYGQFILDRYSEPQRHYHTMNHLEDAFTKLDTYLDWRACLSRTTDLDHDETLPRQVHEHSLPHATIPSSPAWLTRLVLDLSILFHDAVYDPARSDNEELSARLARDYLRHHVAPYLANSSASIQPNGSTNTAAGPRLLSTPETLSDMANPLEALHMIECRVCENIEATKHHLAVAATGTWSLTTPRQTQVEQQRQERPTDTQIVLDVDLAILGSGTWEDYALYAARVREEYGHLPWPAFKQGRIAFLSSFLSKPQWFKTAFFYYRYEARARKNAQRELDTLRSASPSKL